MISKAVARYLRVSPRKVREVICLVKGKNAIEARDILSNTNKRAANLLGKVLNSAIANAKRIPNINEEDLYISDLFADGGPSLKRFKAATMGKATMIKRRTSHITVKLNMREQNSASIVPKKRDAGKGVKNKAAQSAKSRKEDIKKTNTGNLKKKEIDKE
ncbi:MAG: 50S ribosomal protein L22 [Candidatus Omnitrophota bacterium]